MEGSAIIIAGATRTGKTTFTKERLSKVNKDSLMIYDINGEYKEFYDKPFIDFESFMQNTTKVENAVIVYEEATIFFSNRGTNRELTELLVRKRHSGNTILMCFHSIRSIPRHIIDLSNFIAIKKTNDAVKLIDKKFEHEDITKAVEKLKTSTDPYETIIIQLY